jgi:hypothetical protein
MECLHFIDNQIVAVTAAKPKKQRKQAKTAPRLSAFFSLDFLEPNLLVC